MDLYSLSDQRIAAELGQRLHTMRLQKNITQQQLAATTTLSLNTIKSLEAGNGKLSTVIAILRELKALDQLNYFLPEPLISPLQLAKMQGKQRQRASGGHLQSPTDAKHSEW